MPYLKFPTRQEEDLAWKLVDFLGDGNVTGLVARINTAKHGLVSFFSEEPYMAEIIKIGINYIIISLDEIFYILVDVLRESHPQYALEL